MKTILFIEDESALQKTFGDTLRKEGYKVVSATDGETGVNMVKSVKPDLVLLDLILPKMDGFEVLGKIKEDKETAGIPVIILTNLESNLDVEKALEFGATTYLVKANYELKELVEKVKEALKA